MFLILVTEMSVGPELRLSTITLTAEYGRGEPRSTGWNPRPE